MTEGKKRLIELEEGNKYVFHGSPEGGLEKLSPRQAKNYKDKDNFYLDGEPAVCATPYIDVAIFMAIINSKNIKISNFSGFGRGKKGFNFRISSKEALDQTKDKFGFVYVFSKNNFTSFSRENDSNDKDLEWRCYKEIEPIEVIKVFYDDLPKKIDIVS